MRELALLALALAGCTSVPGQPEARTTHLLCDRTIPLDVSHDGLSAVVRDRDGNEVVLNRVATAPGVRYEGSGIAVMRTDDSYVYVARDGSTHGCELIRR